MAQWKIKGEIDLIFLTKFNPFYKMTPEGNLKEQICLWRRRSSRGYFAELIIVGLGSFSDQIFIYKELEHG